MTATSTATDALTRHQARRASGVPTVSALVGPAGLSVRTRRGWANPRRPCVIADTAEPGALLAEWVGSAFTADAPAERAIAWLAPVLGRVVDATAHDLKRVTRYDLDVLRGSGLRSG